MERMIGRAIVFVMAFCLVAVTAVLEPAHAAGEFTTGSPYSSTGRSTYYHNGRFAGNLIVNGVDISDWQSKNCDFRAAKENGVDFAIMRVTWTSYGSSSLKLHADDNFQAQYNAATAAGVMRGAYVFSQAKNATEGAQEATYAINRLKALGIGPGQLELPVYMDYEFAGGILGRLHGISKTAATNAAVAFCNTIKAAGYTPGIYASTTFFNSYLYTSQFAGNVDMWCAQYYSRCQLGTQYSKWQYSSSAKINGMLSFTGLKGKIDADFWYIDQKPAAGPLTRITGRNRLSLADAQHPKFNIYNGGTLLAEGRDYIVGGIRNNKAGQGYAYIKGIGAYGGYALVPIAIGSATEGAANQELNGACANYITYADNSMSSYVGTASVSVPKTKVKSIKGKKKAFWVKVSKKKKSKVSGYEVKYSRNKDMSDYVIKTIGKKYNKVSKTIKTNARKRNYYVQVRSYKDSNGMRYYSNWSAVKKVKVK